MKKLPLFFALLCFFNGFGQTSMQVIDVNLYGKKIVCPNTRTSLYFKYDGASPFEQKGQKFSVQLTALDGKTTEIDGFPTEIDRDYSSYKYSTISFITPNLATGFYTIKLKIAQPKTLISEESKIYVLNSFPQISFSEPEKNVYNSISSANPIKLIVTNEVESNNLQVELNDKKVYSVNSEKSLYLNPPSDFTYKIERIVHECGTSEVKNSNEKQVKILDDIIVTQQGENIQCVGKTHKINFSVKDKSKLLNRKFIAEIYEGSAVLKTIPTIVTDSTAQFLIPDDLAMGRSYSFRIMAEDKLMMSNYSNLYIHNLRLPNYSLLTKELSAKNGEVVSVSGTMFNAGEAKLLFDNGQIISLYALNRKFGTYNVGEDTNLSLGKNGQASMTSTVFYNEKGNLRITGITNVCGTQPLDLTIKINTPKEVKVVDFPKSICGDTKFQIKIDEGENINPNDYEIRFFNSQYNYFVKNDVFILKKPTLSDKGTLNFQMQGIENYRRVNFFVIVHNPTGNTSTLKPIILRKAIPVVMYSNTFDRFNHAITVTVFDIDATYDDTLKVSLSNGKQLFFNKSKTSEIFPIFSDKPFKLATTKVEHVCGNFSLNFETTTNPSKFGYVPMAIEKNWTWVCAGSTIKTRFIALEDFSKVTDFRFEYRSVYNQATVGTLKFKKTDQDIEFEAPPQGGTYTIRLVALDGRTSNEIELKVSPKNLFYTTTGNTLLQNPEFNYPYYSSAILQKNYFNNLVKVFFSASASFNEAIGYYPTSFSAKNMIIEDQKGNIYQSKNNPEYIATENTVYTIKEIETACEVLKPNQKFEFIKTPYIFSTDIGVTNPLCSGEEFSVNLRKFNVFPKNTKYLMKFYENASDTSPVVFEAPMKEDTINSKLVMKVPDVNEWQGKFLYRKVFASIDGKEYTQVNGLIITQINQVSTAKLSASGNALTIELSKNSTGNFGSLNQGSSFYFDGQKYTNNGFLRGNYFIANIRNRCGFIKTDEKPLNLLGDSTQNRAYLSSIYSTNVYQNCVNDSIFLVINTYSYYAPPYIFTDKSGAELFRTNQAIEYKKLKTDIKYLDAIRLKTGSKSVITEKGFSLFNVPDFKVKTYAAVYANEGVLIEEANNNGGLAVRLTTDDANEFYLNKGILKPENKVYKIKQAENMCGKVNLDKDIKVDVINDVSLKTEPFFNNIAICKNDTLSIFYNVKSGSLRSDNIFALQMYDDKGALVGELPSANQQTSPIKFKLNENQPIGEYYVRLKTTSPASVGASSSAKKLIEETSTAKISDIKRPTSSNTDAVVTIELNNKSKNVTTNNSIVFYKINDEIKKVSAEDIRSFNLFVPFKNAPPVFELLSVSSNTCKNWKIEGEKKVTIELITALEENINFKIYPNPTSDFISIEGIESMNKGSVELFSSNGKSVLKESIENLKIENKININDLPSGVYILKIYDSKKEIAFKLSKF